MLPAITILDYTLDRYGQILPTFTSDLTEVINCLENGVYQIFFLFLC